ncbi:hypothetical protein [Actinoplanes xinjiangensis]|uniref:hypothetical protein n=1 Tax=Actinoplanes xinjiangensis TaxID=512350 RepID=UPI00341A3E1A
MATNRSLNNPARRLHAIMEAARSLPPDTLAAAGWASIQNRQHDEPKFVQSADLLAFLSHIGYLVKETSDLLRRVEDEDDVDIVFAHFNQVVDIVDRFPMMANNNIAWSLQGLDNGGMMSLRVAGSLLNRYAAEPSIPEDEVQSLLEQVRDLIREVHQADDLDDKTKKYILDLLLKIERSLAEYKFLGIGAVESALNETTGALRRNTPLLSRLGDSKVMHGFVTLVYAVDLALNMGANAKELGSAPEAKPSPVVIEIVQDCGITNLLPPALESAPASKPADEDQEGKGEE